MDADKDLKSDLNLEAQEEPQVIAEFRIQMDPAQQFLEEYNHCCLCGSELMFSHSADYLEQVVSEEAHCPSCNVRTKKEVHRLQ